MLRGLRRRLTVSYMAVLALILVGYTLGVYGLVRGVLIWGAEEGNHHLAMPVVSALHSSHAMTPDEVADELEEQVLAPDERLEVLDPAGRVLGRVGPAIAPGLPLTPGQVTLDGPARFRVLTVPVVRQGRTIGYVRAAHALSSVDQALSRLGWVLAALLPLALLVAWAAGDWLTAQAVRPVEAALARERQFMHDASHELRTPLAVLTTEAELALQDPELGDEARARVGVLVRSARKLARLVGDLLTLSREDAGAPRTAVRFGFDELIDEEVAALRPLAAGREVALAWEPPEQEAAVSGEPERLGQAVRNVIDNAIRYARPGSTVRVTLERRGPAWALAVTNEGEGIPETEQSRIFERFQRTDSGRRTNPEGTGLGLAISRAIARSHGGELTVASRPEGPTTFTLRVPAAP